MRLLHTQANGSFSLITFEDKALPPYAILSHTWGSDDDEVSFHDLKNGTDKSKAGYQKLLFCSKQAAIHKLEYFWIDTCCIDKSSSQELSEAINSMFSWYRDSDRCFVYLADVSGQHHESFQVEDTSDARWISSFKSSRWFQRGWTLQELLAPTSVEFFSKEGSFLGDKKSLEQTVHKITGIAIEALRGRPLTLFDTGERFAWSQKRTTKREEDAAYCLLGIFGVFMPLLYSEGHEHALARLKEQISKAPKSFDQEQKDRLYTSLQFDHMDSRQTTIKNAYSDTCEWIIDSREYRDWLDQSKLDQHHGFLWIKGKPGSGKSTLMKFTLANARIYMSDRTLVSFFFNARGADLEKSTAGAYRSLVLQFLQLLFQDPAYRLDMRSLGLSVSSISADHHWDIETLETALQYLVQSLEGQSVICFIDALDECQEDQVRNMIACFQRIGKACVSSKVCFRVCLSSRHYPHITIEHGIDLNLDGRPEHDQDIARYLQTKLQIGRNELARDIRREIQGKASGVFLWVVLVVNILNKEYDRGRVHTLRRRLRDTPGDLHDVFRDMLTRDVENKDELVLCLQWILYARYPLSPTALYLAILSGTEPEELEDYDPAYLSSEVVENFLIDASKGLVDVTKSVSSPTVQFIHESIRDFLVKENGLGKVWSELMNLEGESQEELKRCCLNQIICPEIETWSLLRVHRPFLFYAVENVFHHAELAEGCGIDQSEFLLEFPFRDWIELNNFLTYEDSKKFSSKVSMSYVLAQYDRANLLRAYPGHLTCLEIEEEQYGAPLFAAMANNSHKAVEVFVEGLCNIQGAENPQRVYASYLKRCEAVRGYAYVFDSQFRYQTGRDQISYLAQSGQDAIADLLLKTGKFHADKQDISGRTPLSWAAESGCAEMVKMLLGHDNVNPDLSDNQGRTPLSWAAGAGHEGIVRILLDTGKVSVDVEDNDGRTPFWWAMVNGRDDLATTLFGLNPEQSYKHLSDKLPAGEDINSTEEKRIEDSGFISGDGSQKDL